MQLFAGNLAVYQPSSGEIQLGRATQTHRGTSELIAADKHIAVFGDEHLSIFDFELNEISKLTLNEINELNPADIDLGTYQTKAVFTKGAAWVDNKIHFFVRQIEAIRTSL